MDSEPAVEEMSPALAAHHPTRIRHVRHIFNSNKQYILDTLEVRQAVVEEM